MTEIERLPDKERLIVQRLRNFIDTDAHCTVALVSGVRQTGKTTALKQLRRSYGATATYVDLSVESDRFADMLDGFIAGEASILLLDEISYLRDYEVIAQSVYNMSTGENKRFKVIITGSSAAHLTKLSISKLGGGRARLFRLPPVMFVEYLYFTGRIQGYSSHAGASAADFSDYLRLKGLSYLTVQFDDDYFDSYYREVEIGNRQRGLSHSLVDLHSYNPPFCERHLRDHETWVLPSHLIVDCSC